METVRDLKRDFAGFEWVRKGGARGRRFYEGRKGDLLLQVWAVKDDAPLVVGVRLPSRTVGRLAEPTESPWMSLGQLRVGLSHGLVG